jgi:hypothetical protein
LCSIAIQFAFVKVIRSQSNLAGRRTTFSAATPLVEAGDAETRMTIWPL